MPIKKANHTIFGAVMNTNSIRTAISPFLFSTRNANQFNRLHTAQTPNNAPFKLEKDQPSWVKNPEKIAEKQVLSGLKKAIGADDNAVVKADDTEFNPEKLADKILKFVKKTYGQLQHDDPDFDKAKFFSQIKQGLETGFSDAKEALGKLGLLAGQTQQNIDAAYAKIQGGLSKLESKAQAPVASSAELQGFSAQISQSADVEIVTKEGDVVKIRLAQSASNSQSAVNIQQDGQTASAFQISSESSSNFSVTVDGNLNEDEQKALKKLLKDMDSVGKDFFNGNVKDAFNHVKQIGLDNEQIASFSMSLSMEKSVQAVAAYQQISLPDQKVDSGKLKQAADFFTQADELLKTAKSALKPFENPLSAFNALFDGVVELGATTPQPKPAEGEPSLQQIVKPLSQSILGTDSAASKLA